MTLLLTAGANPPPICWWWVGAPSGAPLLITGQWWVLWVEYVGVGGVWPYYLGSIVLLDLIVVIV